MKEKFYITTAIAYASRKPHIGNTYEIVLTDAIARYKRQMGFDVYFLTGSDEHGQKVQDLATQEGISPKEYVDKIVSQIKGIWDIMDTSYDQFIRTTDEHHEKVVAHIFQKLYDQGDIYKDEYEGYYCVPCETFYTETQLNDGMCPDCGRPVKKAKEEAYFFKMSKYQDKLMQYIEDHPDFICPPARKNEMVNNFLKPGLSDLCVSRTSFDWGVKVPFDEKHVIYVWIDALANYITALGYDVNESGELYQKYWPCDVHIIGKDILRFHTIYWPIILMALGEPLPKKVFGHPWLLFGNDKMSKSKGNVLYADDLVKEFGVDAIRFYVLSEMPYAQDGSITYETLISKYNSELANTLGNLLSRTVAMVGKYFDGKVPARGALEGTDSELVALAEKTVADVKSLMDEFKTADALDAIFTLLRRSNKYIDETEPWALAKDESKKGRLGAVLYNLIEVLRISSVLLTPFMPSTAVKIREQIGQTKDSIDSIQTFGASESGNEVHKGDALFNRIDEKKFMEEVEKKRAEQAKKAESKSKEESSAPVQKPEITIDDFSKVDIKVGVVQSCEPVKKSNKLLVSQVQIGSEVRQIVSGIRQFYSPEEMVGKKVLVVTNLKPVKLCGVLSSGMLLAASDADGNLSLCTTEKEIIDGSEVR